MDWQDIDKRLVESIDLEFYEKLDPIEEIVFDLKYMKLMPTYQISSETNYSEKTIRRTASSIRSKYMEYINVKEV
ncbi:MAG: hypothetical protein Q3988_05620 [Gemella sp.]|nr:hypothetical protein [Gemella sp.]